MKNAEKTFGVWVLALSMGAAMSASAASGRDGVIQYALGQQDARPVLNAIKKYSAIKLYPEEGEPTTRRLTTYIQPGEALVIRCEDLLLQGMETPIVSCDVEINVNKKVRGVEFIEGRFGNSYLMTLSGDPTLTRPFSENFARFPYESSTRIFFRDPNRGGSLVSFPVAAIECVQGLPSCWLALVKE